MTDRTRKNNSSIANNAVSDATLDQRDRPVVAAIVGQPNSGKSTLFQLLTRIHQEVGNYPGMTSDARSGHYHESGFKVELVDLPGTYSLSGATPEERIARNFLLTDKPEVVIDVMDSANFRRHLFLLLELLEMQIPLIVCLNFMDVARRRGIRFDLDHLRESLGIPVVPFVAVRGENLPELRRAILTASREDRHEPTEWRIDYGPILEPVLARIERAVRTKDHLSEDFSPRWLAVKLLENDPEARRIVEHHTHDDTWGELLDFCDEELNLFILEKKRSPRKMILERRYRFAGEIDAVAVERIKPKTTRYSDRIDAVVCHPILGPIILFALMVATFQLTFHLADGWRFVPFFSDGQTSLVTPVEALGTLFHQTIPDFLDHVFSLRPGPFRSLIREGILAGMGGVIQFVPVIFVLFFLLAILEMSGYIARVAMIMDRFMRRFNLQGQSILPMILGGGLTGGCAVPAILSARSITNRRQRLLTVLAIPMLHCSGKVPVYAMIVSAFFPSRQGLVMTGLVIASWTVALLSTSFLGRTVLRGQNPPLLLELPTYQLPPMKEVLGKATRQSGEFLKKAGTIILAANIVLWFLMTTPWPGSLPTDGGETVTKTTAEKEVASTAEKPAEKQVAANAEKPAEKQVASTVGSETDAAVLERSWAAKFGRTLEPVSRLAGFDWKDNVSLLGGLATKELIVSSMTTLYHSAPPDKENVAKNVAKNVAVEAPRPDSLKRRLAESPGWTTAKALALLVFVMLYAPCSGTLVAIRRVADSWRWSLLSFFFNTILAFALATVVFQLLS